MRSTLQVKEVWEQTVQEVAASASRQSNITGAIKYVDSRIIFDREHCRVEVDDRHESLLNSLEVVRYRVQYR